MNPDDPQKPKLTTDGKQVASHSYSMRSKAKRTSYYDDNSSELQAQEPPHKRQTKLGAKQKGESVRIKHNDPTPDSNTVETNTVDENTPSQTALQNHLVLESLLQYMNRSDLLRCRIVNKQWQHEATKELRRRKLVIKFSFLGEGNQKSRRIVFRDICRCLSKCRTPSLLSSFQVKTRCWNDLGSGGVKSMFTTVGKQMKQLTLHLNYVRKTSSFESSTLMTDLQNLLFRQAPNLEFLEIKFDFPDHWKDELKTLDSSVHHQNDNNEFGLLPNLKTLIIKGSLPPRFLADVVNAAVNLRSLGGVWSTSSFVKWFFTADRGITPLRGFSSACIKYFMGAEGRDKIHLLKKFKVYNSDVQSNDIDIDLMEKFLTEHKQNLQLEAFACVSNLFGDEVSYAPRIVSVVNQILESSSGSLQTLTIEPAKWFEDLLIIPPLLKLQEICFDCLWSSCMGLDGGGFFPRGFNMNNSFPNVSSIVLLSCSASLFRMFVSRIEIEMTQPVPSVRYITLIDMVKKVNTNPSLATVTDFCHVFPNLVSISCVDKEKCYEI